MAESQDFPPASSPISPPDTIEPVAEAEDMETALLKKLRVRYLFSVSEKCDRLVTELCRCVADAGEAGLDLSANPPALMNVHRQSHGIAGSGGSYGFPGITSLARRVEHGVAELLDQDTATAAELILHLEVAMHLRKLILGARENDSVSLETLTQTAL